MAIRRSWSAGLLVCALGCAADSADRGDWQGPTGDGASARNAIGREGGTLTLGGAVLTLPEGALAEETTITLVESKRPAPREHHNYSPVYRIEPEGLALARPATLTLPIRRFGPHASLFAAAREVGGFAQIGGARRRGAVSAEIDSLAQAFVGDGRRGCADEPCAVASVERVDKVDLLFVVDNSGSMREEQAALRREFPRLIRILTSGDRDEDGTADFEPAPDLHLGVVSSDMGLLNVSDIDLCEGPGDDGVLQNTVTRDPAVSGCRAEYPRFLEFSAGADDPDQTARDFACIATLGTGGCGFEQQLEAALKAVWPAVDIDAETQQPRLANRIRFLEDANGFGALGHGDQANAGFLRNDPLLGRSLVAVIVVTDEEDCSSRDTRHFTPDARLEPDYLLQAQSLNLRCVLNRENLYPLERYVDGLKALREDSEHLVVFAAIAGVPADLVAGHALDALTLTEPERDAYYQRILDDPRMQDVIDGGDDPGPVDDQPAASCETPNGRAYPPRRIVEVARAFGGTGVIQSICQEDFGPAIDTLIACIALQLER